MTHRGFFVWKITATSGHFWAKVEGETLEVAAQTLAAVLQDMGVTVTDLRPVKREGPPEQSFTVYGQRNVIAGRGVWAAIGRLAEFQANEILARQAWTRKGDQGG